MARRIATPLGELYVEDSGEGEPLVFFHSLLHHGGMWRGQIAELSKTHRTINIDAPGHGRSSAVKRAFDMDECVRCVEAVMDALGVERATLLGSSWGGMVALAMAVSRPERLTSIVVMDSSCSREPLGNRVRYLAMGAVAREVGPMPLLLDRIEPLYYAAEARTSRRDELVEPWRSYVVRMDRDSIWHALNCVVDRRALCDELRSVRTRAMVIVGAEDIAQPPRESELIASRIPGARLAVIPRAGHLAPEERPVEVNALLRTFLA